MNLGEVRQAYYDFSGKLSDNVRQLNFAGIAVVWIFRVGQDTGGIPFAQRLIFAMAFFVCSLGLDLLHYIWSTIVWGCFSRYKERQEVREEEVFGAPRWFNRPSITFLCMKVIACIVGYVVLLIHIGTNL